MKILWSPINNNKFLTYSNSVINLYETKHVEGEAAPQGSLHLSDDLYATTVSTLSDANLTKCVEWYPGTTPDNLIAIGQANGKVILSNFGRKGTSDMIGKEFIPKHLRHCLYLAWNPVHHNLLAEGLEKHRNDSCISIWDVNTKNNSDLPNLIERQRFSSNLVENSTKPILEAGMGDISSSFAWFNKQPRTFITGINGKCLRVYDIRDAAKPHLVTHTKYVHGVCSDPLHESRVAAYNENHVAIWDVRNFDKPMLTLPTEKAVSKINWCPTRPGFLAVVCRESYVVKLFDIRHTVLGPDELEPVTFETSIQPFRNTHVACFAWHPTSTNRLLTVSAAGNLKDNQIFEKLPISLSPNMTLSWVFSRKISMQECGSEMEMASRIKQRALQGYGLHKDDLWNNAVVVADEPHLHALWHWLDLSTALLRMEEMPKKPRSSQYVGVLDLLDPEKVEKRSDMSVNYWQYPDGFRSNSAERKTIYQYKSLARSRALQLCGWWSYDKDPNDVVMDPLSLLLDNLTMNNHEHERAAAIALFNLQIGKAVSILSSEAAVMDNSVLNMVAMALSGYTEEKNALWKKTCTDLIQSLEHPYLRAMFAFLASDKDNYDSVLNDDPCMAVKDRVAFACMYLNDNKLLVYLNDLSRQLKLSGNLDGILLTGLTNDEGLELLGNYVDITSDVQTAALAVIYSSPSELAKDERVLQWIEGYRVLLDRWQLWHQRAKFDIIRHSVDKTRVPSQAFVSCNFCGKSVACNLTLASRSRPSHYSSLPPTNRPKITCCPGCRKPLPRCALCLTNLGTPSGSGLYAIKDKGDFDGKLSSFDNWFTWCQSCRHGGHSSHVTDWFNEHSECPVTGCQCKCMTLDPNSQLTAETSKLQLCAANT